MDPFVRRYYNVGFARGVADYCEISYDSYNEFCEGLEYIRVEIDNEVVFVTCVNEELDIVMNTPDWDLDQLKSYIDKIMDEVGDDLEFDKAAD